MHSRENKLAGLACLPYCCCAATMHGKTLCDQHCPQWKKKKGINGDRGLLELAEGL